MNRFILIFAITFSSLYSERVFATKKIWIDTDNSFGKYTKDVDDALAIILCLNHDSIEIMGISIVKNNKYGCKATKKLLNQFSLDTNIRVYEGAESNLDLGRQTDASLALTEALKKNKLTILALGQATNVATVIQRNPEIKVRIEEIIFCGARLENSVFKPGKGTYIVRDANFELDPKSVELILETEIPIVFSGYEAASSIIISKQDLIFLKNSEVKYQKWMYKKIKQWTNLWTIFLKTEGFMPFDAVTASYLLSKENCNCKSNLSYQIKWKRNDSKTLSHSKYKHYLEVSETPYYLRKVTYCYPADKELKEKILENLEKNTVINATQKNH